MPILFSSFLAEATHLIGGYMNYEYLATLPSGNIRYKVTLNLYRDCFQSEVPFDDEIPLGVYLNNNNKDRYTIVDFNLITKRRVRPPGSANCTFYDENVCIEYGFYEGLIELPPSSVGYHLTFQRCCRNKQTNIPEDGGGIPFQGQTYYCFIPDNLYQNSSPVFSGVPSPFMCAKDTTTFDFSAYDKDGDELTYRIVHPYAGASPGDALPQPPDNLGNLPLVQYNAGYTYTQPFGTSNGSIANVDGTTGLTTFMSPSIGSYIVAIEVTESRDGVVLSRVRMDLQILVLNCPDNNRPQITGVDGEDFTIEEGETLCFDVEATDPDDDFLKLSVKGPIYDGSNNYNGPRATFFYSVDGTGNASGEFCWTPDCDMDRDEPYIVRITAEDDGCPPKFNTLDFTITVTPFVGADQIDGPTDVCQFNSYMYTAVGGSDGSTYIWEVVGGSIVGKDDSSTVMVDWSGSTAGTLRMTEVSQYGCPGETTEINVNISESPELPIISGKDTVCENEIGLNYSVGFTAGHTYTWSADNASFSNVNQNQVTIGTYSPPEFSLRIVEENSIGCTSDTGIIEVFVSIPQAQLYGPTTVCPNAEGVEYIVTGGPFTDLNFTITGERSFTETDSSVIIDWGDEGVGSISVTATNKFGCVSTPNSINIQKSYVLDPSVIFGVTDVCELEQGVEYSSLEVNGVSYLWNVGGGVQSSGDSSALITVDWGTAGTGSVSVQERAYDLINDSICLSPPARIDVTIHPLPIADEIIGNVEMCQFEDTFTYTINGYPNSSFEWMINGNSNNIIGQGSNTIRVYWNTAGSFVLSVKETSDQGCEGMVVDTLITVHPVPTTTSIQGPDIICPEDVFAKDYSVNGLSNSSFYWEVYGDKTFSGQGTDQITVDWEPSIPSGRIRVAETTEFGCTGDTIELEVEIDRLAIDMRVVSVGSPDDRMIIEWQLAELSQADEFTIQKRTAGAGVWNDLITLPGNVFRYIETPLNTDVSAYEYRVVSTNQCGTQINSEAHTSILLQGYQDENFDINMTYSPYFGWDNGVDFYQVYESINNGPFRLIPISPLPNQSTLIQNDPDQFKKCYRILAHELEGNVTQSWSNEICFTFSPEIFVPNAFTPNNDNLNDGFGAQGIAIKEFNMLIYNRWGEKLYETNNIDDRWDATYRGDKVQMGTYVYLITFTDFDDKVYQRTGTINLIY